MYFALFSRGFIYCGAGTGDSVTGRTDVDWIIWFAFFSGTIGGNVHRTFSVSRIYNFLKPLKPLILVSSCWYAMLELLVERAPMSLEQGEDEFVEEGIGSKAELYIV